MYHMKKNIFIAYLFTNFLFSQNVVLDSSFGVGGKVITSLSSNGDGILTSEFQTDGRIVSLSSINNGTNYSDIILSRHTINGSLDLSFGINGVLNTNLKSYYPIHALKIQSDDKILVSGSNDTTGGNFSVKRFNSDGTIDTTFGNNGVSLGAYQFLFDSALEIQNDSKILISGSFFGSMQGDFRDFGVIRLNLDGTLDTTFGNFGKVIQNIALNSDDIVYSVKTLSDNKIIVSGYNYIDSNTGNDFVMMKLNSDGTLDTTFGTDGKIITDFGGSDFFPCLALGQNDEIFVGGITRIMVNNVVKSNISIGKYNSDGLIDTSFGINGKVNTQATNPDFSLSISEIIVLNDGKLMCAGVDYNTQIFDMLIFRYNSDGTLDTTFDSDGIFNQNFNPTGNYFSSIKIQSSGRIICGGSIDSGSGSDSVLVGYNVLNLSVPQFSKSQFSVSPNPFSDSINLSFTSNETQILDIDLFDVNGGKIQNLVSQKQFSSGKNQQKLDLPETLSKGIYFLNLNDGNKTQSIKIIK
jgi:uncharacterized delta-60 repeat protein